MLGCFTDKYTGKVGTKPTQVLRESNLKSHLVIWIGVLTLLVSLDV